jgi:cytochrome c biogenesis protein
VLLQELPFAVELKKFIVEYYSTGMPKLFASEVVIHDKATGETLEKRIEVNHPASYRGIEIYQSSFDDGGSSVKLHAVPLEAGARPFEVEGVIGGSSQFTRKLADGKDEALTLEFAELRTINVENFGGAAGANGSGTDVRKVDLRQAIDERLGAAHKRCLGPGARVPELHAARGHGRWPAGIPAGRARQPGRRHALPAHPRRSRERNGHLPAPAQRAAGSPDA